MPFPLQPACSLPPTSFSQFTFHVAKYRCGYSCPEVGTQGPRWCLHQVRFTHSLPAGPGFSDGSRGLWSVPQVVPGLPTLTNVALSVGRTAAASWQPSSFWTRWPVTSPITSVWPRMAENTQESGRAKCSQPASALHSVEIRSPQPAVMLGLEHRAPCLAVRPPAGAGREAERSRGGPGPQGSSVALGPTDR